jgi:hypothetical protein
MSGEFPQPDVSRLVRPRRSQFSDSVFDPPSGRVTSTPPERPASDEHSWWGGAGDAGAPPRVPRVDDTPTPEKLLAWPPRPLTAVEPVEPEGPTEVPAEEPVVALETAPCPCGQGLTVAGRSWCLKCGYDSDLDLLRKADAQLAVSNPAARAAQAARSWQGVWKATPAFAAAGVGAAAIVVATVYRREFVPDRTELRVWWTGIEAVAGLVLYLIGHGTAVWLTVRYWTDPQPSSLDPWGVWKYAVAYLPKTRWAFAFGLWGATAFGCAFTLFWMNDYAFKDKTAKPPPRQIDAPGKPAKSGRPGDDKDDGPAVIDVGSPGDGKAAGSSAPDLTIERKNAATAVVIGYVPDPNDPSKVSKLALGTRGPDGTIRFAGYADVDPNAGDAGLGQLAGAKRLVVRPDYVPDRGVVPLEPTLTADIKYGDRDGDGMYRNSLLTTLSKPKDQ